MLNAANREWERAAAMGKSHSQIREAFEDAAKDHRADRERGFGRHSNEPRQPVFRHPLFAEHVPGMNEDRRIKLLGRAPDGLKDCIVEV